MSKKNQEFSEENKSPFPCVLLDEEWTKQNKKRFIADVAALSPSRQNVVLGSFNDGRDPGITVKFSSPREVKLAVEAAVKQTRAHDYADEGNEYCIIPAMLYEDRKTKTPVYFCCSNQYSPSKKEVSGEKGEFFWCIAESLDEAFTCIEVADQTLAVANKKARRTFLTNHQSITHLFPDNYGSDASDA